MDYYLGYRYFDKKGTALTPRSGSFPFGYGLSYTTFSYSNLQVPCATVAKDGVVNVTVDVTNTGTVAGDETVFLFVSYPGSAVSTRAGSYKELKAYRRDSACIDAGPGRSASRSRCASRTSSTGTRASSSWKVERRHGEGDRGAQRRARPACTGGPGTGCSLSDTFTVN